ncbi:MAG TPA: hypothetical protein V6D00_13280 [Pantanalinema sp.]
MRFGVALLLACSSGGFAAGAQAQPGPPGGERQYIPSTVTTIEGTVTAIERPTSPRGGAGVHLVVRSAQETIPVHLGPAWFIDAQQPPIRVGDVITVKGSRVTLAGQPAIVAATITTGGRVFVLRDEAGRPAWAGQRPRTP